MSRLPKPYIKTERRKDTWLVTLMGSGFRGHVLLGRQEVSRNDPAALNKIVQELVLKARNTFEGGEKQADGRG